MIERGCVAMGFYGDRCEEAHDLADQIFVVGGYEGGFGGPEDTLMTHWMTGEDLEA